MDCVGSVFLLKEFTFDQEAIATRESEGCRFNYSTAEGEDEWRKNVSAVLSYTFCTSIVEGLDRLVGGGGGSKKNSA